MFRDRKRLCIICGASREDQELRYTSTTKMQNVILLACLSACGGLAEGFDAKAIYEICLKNRKCLCHPHYVLAVQYIAGEMRSAGKQLQLLHDPQAYKRTAYVGPNDIPPHVVQFVNDFMSATNIHGTATAKDIRHFMTAGIRRYHSTSFWPLERAGGNQKQHASLNRSRPPDNLQPTVKPVKIAPHFRSDQQFTELTSSVGNITSLMNSRAGPRLAVASMPSGSTNRCPLVTPLFLISSAVSTAEVTPTVTPTVTSTHPPAQAEMPTMRPVVEPEKKQLGCVVCGDTYAEEGVRTSSTSEVHNAILLASLLAYGSYMRTDLKTIYDSCNEGRWTLCNRHYVDAAQYIITMMESAGKPLSYCEGTRASRSRAHVTVYSIPSQIVKEVNGLMITMGVDANATERDVANFMNGFFRRYNCSGLRPKRPATDNNSQPTNNEEGTSSNRPLPPDKAPSPPEESPVDNPACSSNDIAPRSDMVIEIEPNSTYMFLSSHDEINYYMESVGETEPTALSKYYLVQGEMLMRLFRFCPECGTKLKQRRLSAVGTAASIRYVCLSCTPRDPTIKRWVCQRRFVQQNRDNSLEGNVALSVAAITTGLRYAELQRWADLVNISFVLQSSFWKVFEWTKGAVANVYRLEQERLLKIVRRFYKKGEGLQLAVDGISSNHNSSLPSQAVLFDNRTKLLLHSEAISPSAAGKLQTSVRSYLQLLLREGVSVSSFTASHTTSLNFFLEGIRTELGDVRHYYDRSKLMRWLHRELRKAAREQGCGAIGLWMEYVKSHLRTAVEVGSKAGLDIAPFFNTCLMHVKGVHEWTMEEATGTYTRCAHVSSISSQSEPQILTGYAYQRFCDVILDSSFQKSLQSVSPSRGASIRDLKNTYNRIFRWKTIPYPSSIHAFYTTMSILHMNQHRLMKLTDKLTAEAKRRRRKRKNLKAKVSPFTCSKWTDQILETGLKSHLKLLEMEWDERSSRETLEMMKGDENYEVDLCS